MDEFRLLYQQDPFYHWFGLDSELIYVAHKAAGGITSVYRQLGIACERLFRQILQDSLGLSPDQSKWSYKVPTTTGGESTLALDGRIPLADVANAAKLAILDAWLRQAAARVLLKPRSAKKLKGAVFEVRQGYKSKDSKRQKADVANAANAYANDYLPVVALLSTQINGDVADRYTRAQWLILRGSLNGTPIDSTYVFCRQILEYDLAGFFERNSPVLKAELEVTLASLLT